MTPLRPAARSRCSRSLRGLLLPACAALLLAACGGGTNGDAPTQTQPEVVAVSGSFVTGDANLAVGELSVKGAAGLTRPGAVTSPQTYSAKLDELTGPYALGLSVVDNTTGSGFFLVSLATKPGTANVTPLTTLVVAEVLGQDPSPFFASLAVSGDPALASVTDARIASAQQRLGRHLQQLLGLSLPAPGGDLITTPFSPVAGDPVYDTITALQATLAARGESVFGFAAQLAAEAALCNAEELVITTGTTATDFCPQQKSADTDSTDPTVAHYRFNTAAGALLVVDGRDDAVLGATLTQTSGDVFACSGAGCAGLTIGAAAADLSRPLTFGSVALNGGGTGTSSGTAVLDGALTAAKPGLNLPPLPCDTNRYYLIYPDQTVAATCAAPDDLGFGAGQTHLLGAARRGYQFTTDGSVDPAPPSIEVRADGDALASVVVYDQDPDTGANRVLYKCVGTACNGVTVGPAVDDADSFAPYIIRVRPIVLSDTALPAIDLADGSASTTNAVTVRATLNSVEIILPPDYSTAACASPDQRVVATLSDETADVCPPADTQGNPPEAFLFTNVDGPDPIFHIGSLWTGNGGSGSFSNIEIRMSGDAVAAVTYTEFDATYQCLGDACTGVSVSAPDADGQRTISLAGTLLNEVEMSGLPGTRTATLDGGFVAPPGVTAQATALRVKPQAAPSLRHARPGTR